MKIEDVRGIDQAITRGQEVARLRQAQLERYEREAAAYRKLSRSLGGDQGWQVASPDSMETLAKKDRSVEKLVREQALNLPLAIKIMAVDGFEFMVSRPIWVLTDEEIQSGEQYLTAFKKVVERGMCQDRPWLWEAPPAPADGSTVAEHMAHVREGFAQPVDQAQLAEIQAKGAAAEAERGARIMAQMKGGR